MLDATRSVLYGDLLPVAPATRVPAGAGARPAVAAVPAVPGTLPRTTGMAGARPEPPVAGALPELAVAGDLASAPSTAAFGRVAGTPRTGDLTTAAVPAGAVQHVRQVEWPPVSTSRRRTPAPVPVIRAATARPSAHRLTALPRGESSASSPPV